MFRLGRSIGRAFMLAALFLTVPFAETAGWTVPAVNPLTAPEPTEDDEVAPVEQIHRAQHSNPKRLRSQQARYGRRHHQRDLSGQPAALHAASMMVPPSLGLSLLHPPLRC